MHRAISVSIVVKFVLCSGLLALLIATSFVSAATPPSKEAIELWKSQGVLESKLASLREFKEALPPDIYEQALALHLDRRASRAALSTDVIDTVRVIVLLVDFIDYAYDAAAYPTPGGGVLNSYVAGTPGKFDSLLFSLQDEDAVNNPTGSMTEFYFENSYGTYFIQGDIFGWYTMSSGYSAYVGTNNGLGGATRSLVAQAVTLAEADGVDFAPYANGGSVVPGVMVIHAGPGAEEGAYGIWSHRSSMSPTKFYDGVMLSGYSIMPEERWNTTRIVDMGVFSHEWGHVLGVQDWYDTGDEPGGNGLGDWCIMAGGSWNNGGRTPAHFNCYSKYLLGFNDMQLLTENISQASLLQAETSPIAYALRANTGGGSTETWFVENRQKVGFDEYLPGHGILIYHFDPAVGPQNNPDRYRLALEEADGGMDLRYNGSSGQLSDAFPGGGQNKLVFHDYTTPNALTNMGLITEVGVWNISSSDSSMTADLAVEFPQPLLSLADPGVTWTDDAPDGDGDGIPEQGEIISMYVEVDNLMRVSYSPVVHMVIDNPDIIILQNDLSLGSTLDPAVNATNAIPLKFQIPAGFRSSRTDFTFTVTSDSASGSGDQIFSTDLSSAIVMGEAQVLLVDDDNGYGNDYDFRQVLDRMGVPFRHWDKLVEGSPTYAELSQYPVVMWMTGSYWPPAVPGGTFTTEDITFLTQVLNAGGNLLMASPSAANQLETFDPSFMTNYLHATKTGIESKRWYNGLAANPAGGDLMYTTRNGMIWDENTTSIAPTAGASSAFTITNYGTGDYGKCGVTYDGAYRTVFLSFAIEFLTSDLQGSGYAPPDSLLNRCLGFFFGEITCDTDDDGDGINDCLDNCLTTSNPTQDNADGDGIGDACDNCVTVANGNQVNSDADTYGDACDNCPTVTNETQADADGDNAGDACDNCLGLANADQANSDADTYGDACDNCPVTTNQDQADADGDGVGDVCDLCPGFDDAIDADADGIPDACDVCEGFDDLADADGDGIPDGCDICAGADDLADADADGVPDGCDACPGFDDAIDADGDGAPDACDLCEGFDDSADADSDTVPDGCDICAGNDDLVDADADGTPDGCDICAGHDDALDADSDSVPDGCDVCPGFDDTADADADTVPDGCDICVGSDDLLDPDSDGYPSGCDNCPDRANPDQADADNDNVGDACCCEGRTGDANSQGGDEPTIGDISVLIDAKFISGTCVGIIGCLNEADINQSGGATPGCDDVTIGDISTLIDYLFIGGPGVIQLPDCQ